MQSRDERRRGLRLRLSVYGAMLVLGVAGVSLWGFWLVVRPPRVVVPVTPRHYELPGEDVTVTTADGLRLAAWLILARDDPAAAPGVVLLHGYPAAKTDMLPFALALHPRFTTLLVDMRYFGRSEGRLTTLGVRERDDLKRSIDLLEARGVRRVGVFGFSLGGAVGLTTAAEDPRIGAVASYAAFADLRVLARQTLSRLSVLRYPVVELIVLWARAFAGGDVTRPSPAAAVRRLAIPTLLIHSREDDQIPFSHAEALRDALAGNPDAEFHALERGLHGALPPDLPERVADFFRRRLPS